MRKVKVTICGVETEVPKAYHDWVTFMAGDYVTRQWVTAEHADIQSGARAREDSRACLEYWEAKEAADLARVTQDFI